MSQWYQEAGSEINQSKTQALWFTVSNKTEGQATPAVSFNGEVIEHTNSFGYLGTYFNRMLTYKTQVKSTKHRCKKVTVRAGGQRHLVLMFQSVILSVITYGPRSHIPVTVQLKLHRAQNEATRVILGIPKDTLTETIRYLLNLPPYGNSTQDGVIQSISRNDVESLESTPRCCQRRKTRKVQNRP